MTFDIILLSANNFYLKSLKPHGAYQVASFLRSNGYSVFVLNMFDEVYQRNYLELVLDSIIGNNTLFVGFSSTMFGKPNMHHLTTWPLDDDEMSDILHYIRDKNIPIVYGGPSEKYNYTYNSIKHQVDYASYGYSESHMLHMIEQIKKDKNTITSTRSEAVLLRHDKNKDVYQFRDNSVLYKDYDLFDRNDIPCIEMARGCIFKCKFCSFDMIGKDPRDNSYIKSPEAIAKELLTAHELFGVTNFQIVDDTFNDNNEKLRSIRDAIKTLPFKPTFWAYIRLDLVSRFPEQLELLKDIGVNRMFFGIESLNYDSLKSIGKRSKPERLLETAKEIKKHWGAEFPVHRHANLMIGLPYETEETLRSWLPHIYKTNDYFDGMSLNVYAMMPGSEIADNRENYGYKPSKNKNNVYQSEFEFFNDGLWENDHWTTLDCLKIRTEITEEAKKLKIIGMPSHIVNQLSGLGYDMKEIVNASWDYIDNPEIKEKESMYIENYIRKLLNFIKNNQ